MVLMPNSRWADLQVSLIPSIPTFSPSHMYSQGCCSKVVWKDSISYSALGIRGLAPSVPLLASRALIYQEACFAYLIVSSSDISSRCFISEIPPQKIYMEKYLHTRTGVSRLHCASPPSTGRRTSNRAVERYAGL